MQRMLGDRPYLHFSANELRAEFEQRRSYLSLANSIAIVQIWIEILQFRKRFRMNGTLFTQVGTLFEEIDQFMTERRREMFDWPDANAEKGDGSFDAAGLPEEGPLFREGYTVRVNGPASDRRRSILRRVFESEVSLTVNGGPVSGYGRWQSALQLSLEMPNVDGARRAKPSRNGKRIWLG